MHAHDRSPGRWPRLSVLLTVLAVAPPTTAQDVRLSLQDAIGLTLADSRAMRSARIERAQELRRLDHAEADRWRYRAEATAGDGSDDPGSVGITQTLDTPYGSEVRLAADTDLHDTRVTLEVSQPLLRGFGTEVADADLTLARLDERVRRVAFRDRVSYESSALSSDSCTQAGFFCNARANVFAINGSSRAAFLRCNGM